MKTRLTNENAKKCHQDLIEIMKNYNQDNFLNFAERFNNISLFFKEVTNTLPNEINGVNKL